MKIIAHRGNTLGPNPEHENKLEYLKEALNLGFDIEVDVWNVNGQIFLGHDEPCYLLNDGNFGFLEDDRVWVHLKNVECYEIFKNKNHCNFFYHQNDQMTLTSKKFGWMFPKIGYFPNSIFVMPELFPEINSSNSTFYGICTDFPQRKF